VDVVRQLDQMHNEAGTHYAGRHRVQVWNDDIPPTASAEVVVEVADAAAKPLAVEAAYVSGASPEPTEAADMHMRVTVTDTVRGEVGMKVPATNAGDLLDTMTFSVGAAGMGAGLGVILKLTGPALPPWLLLLLCATYLVAVGSLTGIALSRRRR
jgi:hypothetical protein